MDLLSLSIGIGLAVGLISSELFGLAAGGMIVPGYFALHLTNPWNVVITLAAALGTYVLVRGLGSVVVLYGRRLTVMMILVGYLVGMFMRWATDGVTLPMPGEPAVIGYIIPGLIALWCERQGPLETVTSLLTVAAVVRLILVIAVGEELLA